MKWKNSVLLAIGILSLTPLYFFTPTTKKENSTIIKTSVFQTQVILPTQINKENKNLPQKLTPPSVDQIRQEVASDPHSTPISILNFAAKLGPKMEQALETEETALVFFEELKKCTLNSTLPVSIQAICLSNVQILTETYPILEDQMNIIKEQASAESVRLIDPLFFEEE